MWMNGPVCGNAGSLVTAYGDWSNGYMYLLLRWLINAAALVLVSQLVPGVEVASAYTALVAALVLGLTNAILRPILLILTLPITIITLGLFALVVNASMVWFVSSIVKGFEVADFWAAFWASIVLWIVGWVTSAMLDHKRAGEHV